MKYNALTLMTASLALLAACNAEKGGTAATTNTPLTTAAVAAPNGGDWSTVTSASPEGGMVMGNPAAKVKLIEYGSLTCPHCREFDEKGAKPLIDNYVKKGLVSWEFRNFVRDPYDITATLVARCGGPSSFFGLMRSLYADQENWIGKLQTVDQAKIAAMQNMSPQQQFTGIAEWAGFPAFAALRGVPRAKTAACLADPAAATKLVQMNSDVVAQYPSFPGTPTFIINGKMVDNTATWDLLEPKLRDAVGG